MYAILANNPALFKVKGVAPFHGLHDATVKPICTEGYPTHIAVEIIECNPESQWMNGQTLYLPECLLTLMEEDKQCGNK